MNKASSRAKIRVFLADDHPIVRRGFQLLLGMEPDLMVCGDADSSPEALQKILALKPDVAVIDLSLRSSSGLELIKQIRAHLAELKILVFTMHAEAIYEERALRAGANGYVTKEMGTEKAIEAIRLLAQNKLFFSDSLTQTVIARMSGRAPTSRTSVELLSDRELEILEAIGNGLGSRQIAEKLGLSSKTVQSHREHIKTKLGLTRASELVNYAYNWLRGH
jgi:DNA-binding NarL/FixJ family response regulator